MRVVCNIYILLHPKKILISYPFLPLGTVHLVISNRCFPNKVVRRWMMLDERSRLEFVGDYLHFAGWKARATVVGGGVSCLWGRRRH